MAIKNLRHTQECAWQQQKHKSSKMGLIAWYWQVFESFLWQFLRFRWKSLKQSSFHIILFIKILLLLLPLFLHSPSNLRSCQHLTTILALEEVHLEERQCHMEWCGLSLGKQLSSQISHPKGRWLFCWHSKRTVWKRKGEGKGKYILWCASMTIWYKNMKNHLLFGEINGRENSAFFAW